MNEIAELNDILSETNVPNAEENTVNMEALFDFAVDAAKVAEAQAKMLDPAGTYIVTPIEDRKPIIRVRRNDEGRVVVSYFAIGTLRDGRSGRVSCSMSPEFREKLNERTGQMEPDYMTKRWVEAVVAYREVFGESPANAGEVVRFLGEHPLAFRIVQLGVPTKANPEPTGEPGTLVVNIRAVKG